MYFCSMILVYPHKQGKEGSTIQHSINWALKRYPNAEVYIIGDHVRGYNNLIPDARSSVRGCDVTHKLLTFARHIGGKFLYMNDDFFIGPKFNEDTVMSNGNLMINDLHAPTYQEACQNTMDVLKAMGCTTINFECHQPVMMDSQKLIELFDSISWDGHNHFVKSLYLNYYQVPHSPGQNLKLGSDTKKAQQLLDLYGSFSCSDQWMRGSTQVKFLTTH